MNKSGKSLYKPLSIKTQANFKERLKASLAEKDVEAAYKNIFQEYYQTTFPSPYGSDGFIEPDQQSLIDDGIRLLLEVKFRLDLLRPSDRAKIVVQCIYYLKKFQINADPLPNVIVGGDEDQMFTIYAPKIYSYLDEPHDWTLAPSNAWQTNEGLYRRLLEDPNLDVYVFDVRSKAFDINEVFKSIDTLSHQHGEFKKLRVDEANLRKVFDEFVRMVFGQDEWLTGVKKIGADEAVSIFIQSIISSPETYIVPTKKNVLRTAGGREIKIDASNYHAFFSRFDRHYSPSEIDKIISIADQLIEEIKRRFHGDFWTPTVWADRAILLMTHDLGEGWRDEYVVWDPAAGTKKLTRDYRFKNLYSSTLHQSEIDMAAHYNRESTTFQYDFLNDDVDVHPGSDVRDLKMPKSLFESLKNNEPIVFYTNPPYGQATEQGETSKTGVADTAIGRLMRSQGFGLASAELYTQFIYRVQKLTRDFNLTNVFFFFFNKGFLASPAYEKFTDQMLDQFEFRGGFMLNAGEFQGTSSAWGIIFSNFELKKQLSLRQKEFTFSVECSDGVNTEILAKHTLQRVAKGDTISDWLKEISLTNKPYNNGKYPRTTGGFNLTRGKTIAGYLREGSIGFMHNGGQNVQFSDKYTNLNTTMNFVDHGSSVTPENFERICVTFACRKSILPGSWINDKDVFRKPSDNFQKSTAWSEFVRDCVVYSLFHRASYQTSLRNFEYAGEEYDVNNEWFFMSRSEIKELAEINRLNAIVYDLRTSDERFVYKYLYDKKLSDESNDVLDSGKKLVIKTFSRRFLADQDHPEWHLMAWDAGYYQVYKIANMFREEYSIDLKQLRDCYKKLETKIRLQVYRDGILEK